MLCVTENSDEYRDDELEYYWYADSKAERLHIDQEIFWKWPLTHTPCGNTPCTCEDNG